jgi:hypothetical protein
MSKRRAALAWAARGYAVFPLVPDGKEPAFEGSWYDISTTDENTIRAYWTDPLLRTELDYNVGVDCTDKVVVDLDVKDGKTGVEDYRAICNEWNTLVVKTPSGGYHLYFEGADSSNASLTRSIDIRSHHGYVVAPGSTIDGTAYTIENDAPPAWVPLQIAQQLRPPYERIEREVSELDNPASVQAGINFVQSTEIAIEGQRGDEITFVTAARLVREFALSVDTAFVIMRDHWNERCVPPWPVDELYQKIENAASYGTAELGRLDPSFVFKTAIGMVEPPPSMFQQSALPVVFGNARVVNTIPPRPWMIDKLLMLRESTLIIAPGSAGKSSILLLIAVHLALGRDIGPYKVHTRCKSIIYNGEDDHDEQSRRLLAICLALDVAYDDVKPFIMFISEDDAALRLVVKQGGSAIVNEPAVRAVVEMASDPEVGLFGFDPLVDVHEVDEGDNPQMNVVMRTIKRIAKEANVAALIAHHSTKGGNSRQEDRVGNMDISRGASAIVFKCRISLTLLTASKEDAEHYGLDDSQRFQYVRMDDAKLQYTLQDDKPLWFHKEGVKLPNGDVVGVFKPTQMIVNPTHIKMRIAECIVSAMQLNGTSTMTITQAVALLKEHEPLMSNKKDAEIKTKIVGLLAVPVEVLGLTLRLNRTTDTATPMLVME